MACKKLTHSIYEQRESKLISVFDSTLEKGFLQYLFTHRSKGRYSPSSSLAMLPDKENSAELGLQIRGLRKTHFISQCACHTASPLIAVIICNMCNTGTGGEMKPCT